MVIGGLSVVLLHHGIAELLMLCAINLDTLLMVGNGVIVIIIVVAVFHTGAIPLHIWLTFANSKLPIWLDNINCNGSETSLLNCTHGTIGEVEIFCNHIYDVGVRCWGESN